MQGRWPPLDGGALRQVCQTFRANARIKTGIIHEQHVKNAPSRPLSTERVGFRALPGTGGRIHQGNSRFWQIMTDWWRGIYIVQYCGEKRKKKFRYVRETNLHISSFPSVKNCFAHFVLFFVWSGVFLFAFRCLEYFRREFIIVPKYVVLVILFPFLCQPDAPVTLKIVCLKDVRSNAPDIATNLTLREIKYQGRLKRHEAYWSQLP